MLASGEGRAVAVSFEPRKLGALWRCFKVVESEIELVYVFALF
jgi:hypothetical protein